ncbi:MAG: SusC/RagA family TonB-linked outer membrane protein, partial [Bacteroides sp.]
MSNAVYKSIDQAKKIKLTGNVKDQTGEPLIGVSVVVENTQTGTITDIDGNFAIDVTPGSMLTISYIGFKDYSLRVDKENHINVTLSEETELLDEVVVVGYGVQKKANLTGSVASIDFEDQAASRPITNVSTALAGLSAGVSVRQASGQPGSDGANIKIRGVGSLGGSSAPLVIIDGIRGVLDAVNPQDIANISVLKDAAAGAIYGSQAANGVILITTKKGSKKDGKVNVRYSGHISKSKPSNLIKSVTDYADYMDFINESFTNIGQDNHFSQATIDLWREKSKSPNELNENGVPNYIAFPNTNWQKAIFENKLLSEHNVSVDGASEKISFLLSAGY